MQMTDEVIWLIVLMTSLLAGILSGVPVMLVLSGVPLLVAVTASFFGAFDLAFLLAYPQRVFGVMNNTLLIAVPLFILMGVLLERSRVAERMLVNVSRMLGGSSAMLALSVVIVSTLIAASTGVIGATIVMLGMISLPALLRAGVPPRLSSGLICASGTLGQIIPPSIVLILLGDQISNAYIEAQRNVGNFAPDPVSVGDLFAGALFPGLVLVALYAIFAVVAIRILQPVATAGPALPPDTADFETGDPGVWPLVRDSFPPILLILAVLGSILVGVATPTEAAAVGVAGTLLLTAANQQATSRIFSLFMMLTAFAAFAIVVLKGLGWTRIDLSGGIILKPVNFLAIALSAVVLIGILVASLQLLRRRILADAIGSTVQVSAMIFGIVLAASLLSLVFRGFGGDEFVRDLLTGLPGGAAGALIATMLVIFLLGFILEFVEIILIVIPIVGPVLLESDFNPVWFGILVAMNLQTSFLTPPFGFALFYFRSVAPKSITTKDIYLSIIPFVVIQLIAMGILVTFPALATWLPSVLFG